MALTIRGAECGDAAAIIAIWNPAIRESLATFNSVEKTQSDIEQMIADKNAAGHAFFIAEKDDVVQGFAFYGQFRGGAGYVKTMEHTIYIAEGAKGGGVGHALMNAVEDHARNGGAHSCFAGVCDANPAGIAFHQKLGYRQVARLKEVGLKFGRHLDLVLMQKHL